MANSLRLPANIPEVAGVVIPGKDADEILFLHQPHERGFKRSASVGVGVAASHEVIAIVNKAEETTETVHQRVIVTGSQNTVHLTPPGGDAAGFLGGKSITEIEAEPQFLVIDSDDIVYRLLDFRLSHIQPP